MDNEKIDILTKARHLVREPKWWIQGHAARTQSGERVHCFDLKAHAFCMTGAISRAAHDMGYVGWKTEPGVFKAMTESIKIEGQEAAMYQWNDMANRTHEEVLKAFDDTIESLKQQRDKEERHERSS